MDSHLCRRMAVIFISLLSAVCSFSVAWAIDYQILFRPDGSGQMHCYDFAVAKVGGPLLRDVNVLSSEGMRQNWGIDTVGGRGPWDKGVWKNRQSALNRINQLSANGNDWYGCRRQPLIGQPLFSMGWPNTPIIYPTQQMWHILFKPNGMGPNCFEFYLALVGEHRVASPGILTPLARSENWGIDTSGGLGSGPEGTWVDYGSASSRMNQLSSYGGDLYGCRGAARLRPPVFSVGWPAPPTQERRLWQILRKPIDRTRPNCFEFFLTDVGGDRVAAPGIMTQLAINEGWNIDRNLGAGSGPEGTWVEFSAASSQMNKLSRYGGDLYGCLNDSGGGGGGGGRVRPFILRGNLDPNEKAALIAKHKPVQVQFECSPAVVRVNLDDSTELLETIQCNITVTDTRRSSDITWSRHTYTVTLTPNGQSRGGRVKALRKVDHVFDYVSRGKQGRSNNIGKPIPVEGSLSQQKGIWHLNLPNGNGGSIGAVPYLME